MPQPACRAGLAQDTAATATTSSTQNSNDEAEVTVKSYTQGRNGWARVVDEDGYTFFYNESTGETQWDAPAAF
jgi:hypothetical protein